MHRARVLLPAGLLLLVLLAPSSVFAAWLPGGTPILTGYNSYSPNSAPDGLGGVLIAHDFSSQPHLFRRNGDGNPPAGWTDASVPSGPEYLPPHGGASHVISDASGGAYFVSARWLCTHSCPPDDDGALYAQRIDSHGRVADGWSDQGVALGLNAGDWTGYSKLPGNLVLSQDGSGGLLVVWRQSIGWRGTPASLRAQRIAADGRALWGDGIDVVAASRSLHDAAIVADGRGGMSIFWVDERDSLAPRVYRQDLDRSGAPRWQAGGVALSTLAYREIGRLLAVSDGAHGAFVVWQGRRTGDMDLFAVRTTHGGALTRGGESLLRDASGSVEDFDATSLPAGGMAVAWIEQRSADDRVVRAQRIDRAVRPIWTEDGAPISTEPGVRYHVRVTDDGGAGLYAAWADGRSGAEVRAAHLDDSGILERGWIEDGTPISDQVDASGAVLELLVPIVNLVHDGLGNAYLVWQLDDAIPEHIRLMKLMPGGPAVPVEATNRLDAAHAARPAAANSLGTLSVRVLPKSGVPGVQLTLPSSMPARLELLDVMGRRMWSREVGSLGAGEHILSLGGASVIPPGVYLVRLSQGDHSVGAIVPALR